MRDVARATGWLHAQDRFFQMDLLRRRGAGELAELFGGPPFRSTGRPGCTGSGPSRARPCASDSPERRALVEAYAAGRQRGPRRARSKPWEYAVLRTEPRPWLPEDTLLISLRHDARPAGPLPAGYVRTLRAIRDELGPASLAFFAPLTTPADAALDGSMAPAAAHPAGRPRSTCDRARRPRVHASTGRSDLGGSTRRPDPTASRSPARSLAAAAALVANDMHLHLGVPNIWYRMRLRVAGPRRDRRDAARLARPVAGSTGRIAWGFTNSNAGIGDIIVVHPQHFARPLPRAEGGRAPHPTNKGPRPSPSGVPSR